MKKGLLLFLFLFVKAFFLLSQNFSDADLYLDSLNSEMKSAKSELDKTHLLIEIADKKNELGMPLQSLTNI